MGKASNTEQTRGHLVDEACNAVHNARDTIAALADAMVSAGERGLAGRLFVVAAQLRTEAMDLRIDYTPNGGKGLVTTSTHPDGTSKPARVRGPRKPKAAARTLPLESAIADANMAGATRGLKDSNDRLEASLAPRAHGGAS